MKGQLFFVAFFSWSISCLVCVLLIYWRQIQYTVDNKKTTTTKHSFNKVLGVSIIIIIIIIDHFQIVVVVKMDTIIDYEPYK